MEYKIVSAEMGLQLEQEVNELIEDGWEPYGNLVVRGDGLVQPMIRFDEEDGEEDDE